MLYSRRLESIVCWIILALIVSTAQAQLADSPWPGFGGNAKNTHRSSYAGPTQGVHVAWRYQSPGSANYQPVVGPEGIVYFTTNESRWQASYSVNAVKPDGSLLWEYRPGAVGPWVCVSADNRVYFTRWVSHYSGGKSLFAVDAQTASYQWAAPMNSTQSVQVGPTISDHGTIYVGEQDGRLYEFTNNGTMLWVSTPGGTYLGTPAIGDDGTLYVGGFQSVRAIDPDGQQMWSFPTASISVTSVSVGADGTIYAGTHQGDGDLYALTPSGQQVWHLSGVGKMTSVALDGTIYASSSSEICAVSPGGRIKWRYEIGERMDASVTADGFAIDCLGNVYASTPAGEVICLDPQGQLQWSIDISPPEWSDNIYASQPVIGVDGLLYVLNGYPGELVAIVPEPATLSLLALGGLSLVRRHRRS